MSDVTAPNQVETHLLVGNGSYGFADDLEQAKANFVKNFGKLDQPYLHYVFAHDEGTDIELRLDEMGTPMWQGFLAGCVCYEVEGGESKKILSTRKQYPFNAEEQRAYDELMARQPRNQ